MPTAIIDGITTRYDVAGSGPPLLMCSPGGFDATIEKWTTQGIYARIRPVEHLSKKFTCIVFDRRESGKSGGRVEAISWAHYVAQAKGLLDHLNISRAHVMGACMGCSPAMAMAVAYPDTVASLVLYWPVGGRCIASTAMGDSPSICSIGIRRPARSPKDARDLRGTLPRGVPAAR